MTSASYFHEASKPHTRQSPRDFAHHIDRYTSNQLYRLEQQITRRVAELVRTEGKLRRLEEELSDFSDQYYTEVGAVCDEIDRLEEALAEMMPHAIAEANRLRPQRQTGRSQVYSTERKALYRRLVKHAHPDTQENASMERFMRIQSAYETGRLAALWEVEWEMLQKEARQCDATGRMQKLLSWFQSLERYGQEMTQLYLRRKISDEAKLMERYMEARLAGRDWMGQMKQQLQTQAQQLKQTLVNAKLQALYMK